MAVNITNFDLPRFKGVTDIESLVEVGINPLANWITGFSMVIAVIFVIISGYTFITSMGEPEKIQKAQKGLTAALIGMVVVFVARLIVGLVLDIIIVGNGETSLILHTWG